MRTLAIDLGAKRVGIAMSDEGGRFATPIYVLTVASPDDARNQVLAMIHKEGVERILIGVPFNMDGSAGPAARSAVEWGKSLAAAAGKPLVCVDERLSTFEADQLLNERKRGGERMTRKGRKVRLDAIAAASFLQAFLDGKLAPVEGI